MVEKVHVQVADGKYTVILSDETPLLSFLRHGVSWELADREWQHANFIGCMARELHEERTLLRKLFNATSPFDAPVPGSGSIDEYENFRAAMKEVREYIKIHKEVSPK